ncbi:TPA: hypothetical protein MAL38_001997 [Klebsiella aerogenes]|nr:hypothetical protein [Klebsiella aerogenes]
MQPCPGIQGRPLSDAWCAHIYRDKFGVWPQGLHYTAQETSPEVENYIRSRQIAFAKGKKQQAA